MDLLADLIGALVATYFVSRGLLFLLKRIGSAQSLVLVHAVSWFLITLVAFYVEGYSVTAGIIYLPAQILWLLFDNVTKEQISTASSGD